MFIQILLVSCALVLSHNAQIDNVKKTSINKINLVIILKKIGQPPLYIHIISGYTYECNRYVLKSSEQQSLQMSTSGQPIRTHTPTLQSSSPAINKILFIIINILNSLTFKKKIE